MSKGFAWLSPGDINKIKDYEHLRNNKDYLKKETGKLVYYKGQIDKIMKLAKNVVIRSLINL